MSTSDALSVALGVVASVLGLFCMCAAAFTGRRRAALVFAALSVWVLTGLIREAATWAA